MRTIAVAAAVAASSTVAAAASSKVTARGMAGLQLNGTCSGTTYDYLMLVEQWAITECMDVFSCNADNLWFTLHGMWPERNNGNYPCTCTSEKFNINDVKDLETELNQYWPSLNGPSDTFWKHEYEKHGTCAEDVCPTQHDFFQTALSLLSQYDAVAALATAGIKPSNTQGFSLTTFRSAITKAYGVYPAVTCDSQGRIEGITYCIGKDLKAMPCPSATTDVCTSDTLYLPASMSTEQLALRGAKATA